MLQKRGGAFNLSGPIIKSLSVQGAPEKHTEKVSGVAVKSLVKFYSLRPVYKLKSSDTSRQQLECL